MSLRKLKTIRIILVSLTVLLCSVIFMLSADNADESDKKSDYFSQAFVSSVSDSFDSDDEMIKLIVEKSVYIVRKSAHFIEYALLGVLLASVCTSYYAGIGKTCLISQLCGGLYAVSDELHQYFVPGRSCQLSDVVLDWVGVFTGICIVVLTVSIYKRKRRAGIKSTTPDK